MLIGIIGNGFVGKATQLLACPEINILVYDIVPELRIPENLQFESLIECDLIFISLPTPMNLDGSCYTNLITDSINKLKRLNYHNIVIRSTVPINYCSRQNVFFMPEFLTEANWKSDFMNNQYWIFGLTHSDIDSQFIDKVTNLIDLAYNYRSIEHNNIVFMRSDEAELLKLVRNTFLANKVGFFNEIYDLATKLKIDYDKVISHVSLDMRIGSSHMKVPGYNDIRGYGGTCFPKDTNSLYNIQNQNKIKSYYLKNSLLRNEYHDQKERTWLSNINRSICNIDRKVIVVINADQNYCEDLSDFGNSILCFGNIKSTSENMICNDFNISNPLFLPKVDEIHFMIQSLSIKKLTQGVLNTLKLTKMHKCKTLFFGNKISIFKPLINEYKNKHKLNIQFF